MCKTIFIIIIIIIFIENFSHLSTVRNFSIYNFHSKINCPNELTVYALLNKYK